jgi:hypothetical protein
VQVTPACVTVKAEPAIVSVPVRDEAPVLSAKLTVVEPLPEPLLPAVMLSQDALLVAVQAHPLGAVTATDVVPAVAPTDWPAGEIE